MRNKLKDIAANNKLLIFSIALLAITFYIAGHISPPVESNILRIESVGQKDEASWGTDVRIIGIYRNDELLTSDDITLHGDWESSGTNFYAMQTDSSVWIEVTYQTVDSIKIVFWKQCGSGYVTLYINGEVQETRNLYSPDSSISEYTIGKTYTSSVFHQILPFILLFEAILFVWVLVSAVGRKREKKCSSAACIFAFLVFSSVMLYFAVEIICRNYQGFSIATALENVFLYFTLLFFVYLITGKISWTTVIVTTVCLSFAIVNYYVTRFRGTPISPNDFYTIQTAALVAGNYEYKLTKEIVIVALVLSAYCATVFQVTTGKNVHTFKQRMCGCIFAAVFILIVAKGSIYMKNMDWWNLNNNVQHYGIAGNIVSAIRNNQLQKPEGYSAQELETFLKDYEKEDIDFRPNIIVVMNESFSDLSYVMSNLDNNAYMPYFNALQENVIKGTALSSALGGGTVSSEYEFLTGNTQYFIPGHTPYQQYISKPTNSLVSFLNDRGYCSIAIHPYYGAGYNRPTVYSHLGFNKFLSIENFSEYTLERGFYVSDYDNYQKVIAEYEKIHQEGAPAFIFNITMQNHSHYETNHYGNDVIPVSGYEGQFPDVEEYLTLIKRSDDALAVLLDYFATVDDPTAILFFGDHQPAIDDTFYELALGKSVEYFTLADTQCRYEIPFLIWTNYDIAEKEGIYTSLNYLSSIFFEAIGVPCSPYQNYLLELKETVPAINRNGYMNSDGNWKSNDTSSGFPSELETYWNLEYYFITGN